MDFMLLMYKPDIACRQVTVPCVIISSVFMLCKRKDAVTDNYMSITLLSTRSTIHKYGIFLHVIGRLQWLKFSYRVPVDRKFISLSTNSCNVDPAFIRNYSSRTNAYEFTLACIGFSACIYRLT